MLCLELMTQYEIFYLLVEDAMVEGI
ncbi:MAG: hypothetical protein ACJAZF_003049, partial [Granulosicoccus sp.]